MRRGVAVLVGGVIALFLCSGQAEATSNYEYFDLDLETRPTGWYSPDNSWEWTDEDAYSGSYSVRIDGSFGSPYLPIYTEGLIKATYYRKGGKASGGLRYVFPPTGGWVYEEQYMRIHDLGRLYWISEDGEPIFVDDIKIENATYEQFHAWNEQLFASFGHDIKLNAASRTIDRLPVTVKKLRNGKSLRMVIVGDSIANDTGASMFELMVAGHFPGSSIEVIRSVRGSTGVGWFTETPERLQEYILQHDPDLVLLGGISHSFDAEQYRDAILAIQAESDVEILAATGTASPALPVGDPRVIDDWSFELGDDDDFRAALARIAEEEGVGFVDLRGSWGEFMLGQTVAYDTFLRDPIHMNQNGMAVTAKALEAYFLQAPEPGSILLLTGAAICLLPQRRMRR